MKNQLSPGTKIIEKIRRNYLAMFGFCLIVLSILIAVAGYLIMPDKSPMANEMPLELSTQKPLSNATFLKVIVQKEDNQQSFIRTMLYGQRPEYKRIPIHSYHFEDSLLVILEYQSGEDSLLSSFDLIKILRRVDEQSPVHYTDQSVIFTSARGEQMEESITALQNEIVKNNIETQTFYLGTDRYGRDMLSRMLLGTRVSLSVGFISVLISLLVGLFLGALAGFFRGWLDDLITWFINVIWSLPSLLLVIAISFALGKGFWQVFIAIGLSMWVEVARMVRGQILSIREVEYVEAARAMGFSTFRIIYKHILPNIMGPLLVVASANFASAILLEAGLSFLGFGAQPPTPTWGNMVKEHYGYIIIDAAYLAIIPGLAIMLLVFAFNIFSTGLRDAFDMKAGNTNV